MRPVAVLAEQPSVDRLPGQPWPIRDAARFLNLSERTLTRAAKAGKLHLVRIGRRVYVADDEMKRVARDGM